MTALNVTFADPNGPNAPRYGVLTAAVQQAFGAWTSHFDAPQGAVTINVIFNGIPAIDAAAAYPNGYVRVGGTALNPVVMPGFGYEVATGAKVSAAQATGTLFLNQTFFDLAFGAGSTNAAAGLQVLEHEIGHMLGFYSYADGAGTSVLRPQTTFDPSVRYGSVTESFVGPNAEAAYGGPVTMDHATYVHPYVPGYVSVMSYTQQAATIQPLDVAILRDTCLPILSDQEVQEHQVARLYQAAFGRAADGAGLLNADHALVAGSSLSSIAAGLVGSQEFANLYGAGASDAAFVNSLYQNVLHRGADAAGAQAYLNALSHGTSRASALMGFADSAEERNALEANPNGSYAETAEAQMERLYDAAFGRAPDAAGFALFTHALVNGDTLQQAAISFMSSAEFTNRYGAAASNKALVDAYYQNTLHRAADAPGEAAYLDALNHGLSRADVLVSFSEAGEHQRNVVAHDTAMTGGYLTDASAHLGSIPVLPGTVGA